MMYFRADKEKNVLQKKLKSSGVTVDHVMGVQASESERQLEELQKRNTALEDEITHLK